MNVDQFDFELPAERIAQYPLPQRAASRLLQVTVEGVLIDQRFSDLVSLIRADDLLVFNNTRVVRARLLARKVPGGGRVEVLFERDQGDGTFLAQIRASNAPGQGTVIETDRGTELEVCGRSDDLFQLRLTSLGSIASLLEREGQMPLPPYIKRRPVVLDEVRYQTVFSSCPGAVAAPTAGLHFDYPLIESIEARGVHTAMITLHVGAGTFQPVRVTQVRQHRMHEEWMSVPQSVIADIDTARNRGGRVIAVGTTVVRALETAALAGQLKPFEGHTGLFVYPGYQFAVVDCLITNFHLPRSTLLMLVSAFGGVECVRAAYRHALDSDYRFFSYGDAMWLERRRP